MAYRVLTKTEVAWLANYQYIIYDKEHYEII